MGKAARLKRVSQALQAGVRITYVDDTVELQIYADQADAERIADGLRPLMDGDPELSGIRLVEVLDAATTRDLLQRHGR